MFTVGTALLGVWKEPLETIWNFTNKQSPKKKIDVSKSVLFLEEASYGSIPVGDNNLFLTPALYWTIKLRKVGHLPWLTGQRQPP